MSLFISSLKKALRNFRTNRFINLVTIVIIALSILMVSVLVLFFDNAARMLEHWGGENRVMVYMNAFVTQEDLPRIKEQILENTTGIKEIKSIPNTRALEDLAGQFPDHQAIFHSFRQNPLPHAMEIRFASGKGGISVEELTGMIAHIKTLDPVESVVYAQGLFEKFSFAFSLITRIGYVLCGLFSLICIFITANTVRLSLHSRTLEVQILRIVGATEYFIKSPFYLAGAIQGFLGGLLGIGILWLLYYGLCVGCHDILNEYVFFPFQFLSVFHIIILLLASTFLGWSGCYLSLRSMGQ